MSQTGSRGRFDFRFVAALLLLAPAALCTWRTIDGLATHRMLRMEQAELGHVRYGILNADEWVKRLVPVLNSKIDSLDLTAQSGASLRPTVEKALYRLIDQMKEQMAPAPTTAPATTQAPAQGTDLAGFAAQAQAMIVNMMASNLRPRVPEFAGVVLAELGRPENKQAVKNYLATALAEGAKNTFGAVDMTWYSAILKQHGCADAATCRQELGNRIREVDDRIARWYLTALGTTALAFLLLLARRRPLRWYYVLALLLFCMVLLAGGILSPMIEVDARISSLTLTFLGAPLSFPEQVLYFQSKSVLEVFRTLIEIGQPEMWFVGVLVLMFSVVFPTLKILTLGICMGRLDWLRKSRILRFFALESSKWSMADVMALAIFMSFVAFNGVISNAMGALRGPAVELVIPTNSSKLLPGFYLFIGFVLASLFLAWKLEQGLKTTILEENTTNG
jgi:Paraquat-inducible protein A